MGYENRQDIPVKYTWDLSAIYPNETLLEKDCAAAGELIGKIKNYEGKLNNEKSIYEFFELTGDIEELFEKAICYTHMKMDEDSKNTDVQAMRDKVLSDIAEKRLSAIREVVPKDICIRIDANQGWTPKQAVRILNNMQDRAIVYVDGKRQGAADRRYKQDACDVVIPAGLHTVDIFVENMGRINFGGQIQGERKGIRGPITLDGKKLENFLIYNLPCKGVELLSFSGKKPGGDQPVFHRGYFNVSNPKDTYLDMRDGWKKGVVWVNGHNLGRFWVIGSQQALYCPGEYLKPGKNEIVVLDVDGGSGTVKGVKEAIYEVKRDPAMADVFRVGKPVAPAASQLVHKGTFAKGTDQQEIKFRAPIQARYIALVSKNAHDNGPHAAIAELNFLDASGNLLPREQWSVVYADSHETTGEAAQAGLVMDNQPTTYWHTKWQGDNPKHPHMIVLDLGKVQKLSGFRYLPRQNRENGRIKDYEVYASPKPFKPAK